MSTKLTYSKSNPESIQKMFGKIAPSYDKGNAVLSFSLHKLWNAALIGEVTENKPVDTMLDLCCGTGEIAYTYLNRVRRKGQVVLLDFCEEMLAIAKKRGQDLELNPDQLTFIQGDAQSIPLDDQSVDCITVAYGIRNVEDPSLAIREAYRVLKPGGRLGILELTRPSNPVLRWGHSTYLKTALPLLGKLFLTSEEAYAYLSSSIHDFISADRLEEIFIEEGFSGVRQRPLMGGVATIVVGGKPPHAAQSMRVKNERLQLGKVHPCLNPLTRISIPGQPQLARQRSAMRIRRRHQVAPSY